MAQLQLRELWPEPWGDKVRRAREAAGLTTRQAADILGPHVTQSTVVRLEKLEEVPVDRKNRGRAALLLLLYGFELDGFDLGDTDLPPAIDLKALERLRALSTKWYLTGPAVLAVAA